MVQSQAPKFVKARPPSQPADEIFLSTQASHVCLDVKMTRKRSFKGGAQKVREKKQKRVAEEAAKCGKITDIFGKRTVGSSSSSTGGAGPPAAAAASSAAIVVDVCSESESDDSTAAQVVRTLKHPLLGLQLPTNYDLQIHLQTPKTRS